MSLDLMFEADAGLSQEQFSRILAKLGVNTELDESNRVCGSFPLSNMYVVSDYHVKRDVVIAEGVPFPMTWKVGMRAVFNFCMAEYDQCNSDMYQFLLEVVNESEANFVLSFQFENVYAIRDSDGLQLLSNWGK